jgi:hypothetical protein
MLNKLKIQAEDMFRYNPAVRNMLASAILLKTPRAAQAANDRCGGPHRPPAVPGGSSCRYRLDDAQGGGGDRPPVPGHRP